MWALEVLTALNDKAVEEHRKETNRQRQYWADVVLSPPAKEKEPDWLQESIRIGSR